METNEILLEGQRLRIGSNTIASIYPPEKQKPWMDHPAEQITGTISLAHIRKNMQGVPGVPGRTEKGSRVETAEPIDLPVENKRKWRQTQMRYPKKFIRTWNDWFCGAILRVCD